MMYGIRPDEQRRLAAAGVTMRVYIPYGFEWYGYLMRRLAERPPNLSFFVKALISKKEPPPGGTPHGPDRDPRRRSHGRDPALRTRPGRPPRGQPAGGGEATGAR